jgi:phosphate-selective porin OprO/OprP
VRARPETHVEGERFLNTGKIEFVDKVNQYGFETAYQHGALIIQGEYINTELDRFDGNANASYDGWYTFASYMLTGEKRPYSASDAEFGVFNPTSTSGAWEIAIRASSIDLNDLDAGVEGGSADEYTLGVNYYPNRNLRFMLNYSRVDHDELADGDGDFIGNDDYGILQARFQVVF